ncbi:hypothetical protein C0993_010851 [Termitomyces sp. T159_Od127]|nr:hypothetical protein C0993_010851 [Termitomyces sp. T159_Od127]
MRWGLASTGSTHHYWHIDANGFGTFVHVETGVKLWFIATPKNGNYADFATWELYVNDFALRKPNEDKWNMELIVLEPGSMLIMRPNLPHSVVTPSPTICRGGHFYCVSTIIDSVVGIFHHYVASDTISNTNHALASHNVLTRLLTFYLLVLVDSDDETEYDRSHVPDVTSWDGLLTIFHLCNYFELHSAILGWYFAYNGDVRAFKASIRNRARARELIYWFFSSHELEGNDGVITGLEALETLFCRFLAQQASALIYYKKMAWKKHVRGADVNIPPSAVCLHIQATLREGPAWIAYSSLSLNSDDQDLDTQELTFSWPAEVYSIRKVGRVEFHFPYLDGHVWGDRLVAERLGISLSTFQPRRDQDNELTSWAFYTPEQRLEEDHVSEKGYVSDTPPESPTLAELSLDTSDSEA